MMSKTRSNKNYVRLLQVLGYPILLLTALLTIFITLHFHLSFGLCGSLFLFWTLFYIAVLEQLIPYDRRWNPTGREWLRDGIYLLLTMIGGGLAVVAVFYIASFRPLAHTALPLMLEIPMALGLSSLGSYVFHRLSHSHPWIWRLHAVHHIEAKVNVGNNGVNHVLDVFGRRLLAQLPMVLLGATPSTLFILGVFNTVQGYFVHGNVDIKFGWLNYILVSPEQHRLHHSKDLSEAGHYSTDIPLWDILFHSFTWKKGRKPKATGVTDSESFPAPDRILASLIYPFLIRRR